MEITGAQNIDWFDFKILSKHDIEHLTKNNL